MTLRDWVWTVVLIDYLLMWLIWLWLTWELLKKFFRKLSQALEEESREHERRRAEIADSGLSARVKALGDVNLRTPEILRCLATRAGDEHGELQIGLDADAIRALAARLSNVQVDMLSVASTQGDFHYDIDRKDERVPVDYPTHDMAPMPISDLADLARVTPEGLMLDDEAFMRDLVTDGLTRIQAFENVSRRGRVYVLEDVSYSMEARMDRGVPRYVWAHGISASLAMAALRGDGEFCRREFDGGPLELIEVTDAAQAKYLLSRILTSGTTGGGTAIYTALRQAIRDIRDRGSAELGDNILLITDGEDENLPSARQIREELGDIKLHVAMIGNSSRKLKVAATTYQVFK